MTSDEDLLDRALGGALEATEEDAFGRLLCEDPAFARRYLEAAVEESVLVDVARETSPAIVHESSGIPWGGLLTMAASLLVGASIFWSVLAGPAWQAQASPLTLTFKKGDRFTVVSQVKQETAGGGTGTLEAEFVMSYRVTDVSKDGVATVKGMPRAIRLKSKRSGREGGATDLAWSDSMPADKIKYPDVRDFVKNGNSFTVDPQGIVGKPDNVKIGAPADNELPFIQAMPRELLFSIGGALSGSASKVGETWSKEGERKTPFYGLTTKYTCTLDQAKDDTAVIRSKYESRSNSGKMTFFDEVTEGQGTTTLDLKKGLPVKCHLSFTHVQYSYMNAEKTDKKETLRTKVDIDTTFKKE